jgi:hypothetical protein
MTVDPLLPPVRTILTSDRSIAEINLPKSVSTQQLIAPSGRKFR